MNIYFLGLDYGGTQIKAGLYNAKGQELAVVSQPTAAQTPAARIVEIDMRSLWESACTCICKLLQGIAGMGIDRTAIQGIATSSHGKGLYRLDAQGKPCGKGILSSDTRSLDLVQSWRKQGLNRAIFPFTLQEIWPAHPLALLGFLAEEPPKQSGNNLEDSRWICMGHDYLRYCLTGEIAAERSNISGSALLDVRKNQYSEEVLKLTGLQGLQEKLPPIIDSSELCGHVSQVAAQATGLREGIPVYGGFFDVVGAAVASGLRRESDYHAIMGTWSISTCLASIIPEIPVLSSMPALPWGHYAALPGMHFIHDGSPSSAGNLNWFLRQFAPNNHHSAHPDYQYNDHILQHTQPDKNDLFFFPYLYASNLGEDSPGSLIGLRSHHDYSDVLYAICEGILFAHKIHLDKLHAVQPRPEKLLLTGGPSQSQAWMQMFADFTGLPVWRLDGTKESGCKGAAMAAAVGSGLFANFQEAMDCWVHYLPPLESRAEQTPKWEAKYHQYLDLGRHLAQFFGE